MRQLKHQTHLMEAEAEVVGSGDSGENLQEAWEG